MIPGLHVGALREVPREDEVREHVEWCQEGRVRRLDFFETDEGWCVDVVHPTSGVISSVTATFMLPDAVSEWLSEFHDSTGATD